MSTVLELSGLSQKSYEMRIPLGRNKLHRTSAVRVRVSGSTMELNIIDWCTMSKDCGAKSSSCVDLRIKVISVPGSAWRQSRQGSSRLSLPKQWIRRAPHRRQQISNHFPFAHP